MGAEALLRPLSTLSAKVREASEDKKEEAEREEGGVEEADRRRLQPPEFRCLLADCNQNLCRCCLSVNMDLTLRGRRGEGSQRTSVPRVWRRTLSLNQHSSDTNLQTTNQTYAEAVCVCVWSEDDHKLGVVIPALWLDTTGPVWSFYCYGCQC